MSFCDKLTCGVAIMLISLFTPEGERATAFFRDVVAFSCLGCSLLAVFGLCCITILIFLKGVQERQQSTLIDSGRNSHTENC